MASLPDSNGKITASQILSYLQKNNLTNEVFAEILSDLKNKQGFKSVRKMVEDLIHSHESQLYSPRTEKTCRAHILNEICSVAFTIDTILPNVLRMKFQNHFPQLVNEILEELKAEKKIKSFVPCTPTASNHAPTAAVGASGGSSSSQSASPPKMLITPRGPKPGLAVNINKAKRGRPRKNPANIPTSHGTVDANNPANVPTASATKNQKNFANVPTTSDTAVANSPANVPTTSATVDAENPTNVPTTSATVDAVLNETGEDLDLSKDSLSVSSVHTSELSSFDDAISISSEDGEKKRLSIKEIQQMTKSEKISSWLAQQTSNKSSTPTSSKEPKGQKKRSSTSSENKLSSSDESDYIGSPKDLNLSPKVLPQRTRKPNSKYVSESIVCPIAPRPQKKIEGNKIQEPVSSSIKDQEKDASFESDQQDIVPGTPEKDIKRRKVSFDCNSLEKSGSSQPVASTVFKSITVMPLTSRKTAPKTLFSTQTVK